MQLLLYTDVQIRLYVLMLYFPYVASYACQHDSSRCYNGIRNMLHPVLLLHGQVPGWHTVMNCAMLRGPDTIAKKCLPF